MAIRSSAPARDRWWRRPYLGVMVLFWAAPGGALLVGYLALPDYVASSQCGGTLFGCSIAPQDAMVLLAVFVYPLVAAAGLLVMGVIAMGRAWHHRPWRGRGLTCPAASNIPARRCPTRRPCRPGECLATALQT
jgi:hypothetical protein